MMKLSPELLEKMKAHGEADYPEECCGLLLGEDRKGERVVLETLAIGNTQDVNRRRRLHISPEQYRQAEQAAAERQVSLLGFYHSHPDHPAVPSAFDTEHALPWFTYVIVEIAGGRAQKATAWLLREDRTRFEEHALVSEAQQ
jgi:proteasome lid subunit RPN8/RPN11